MKHRKLGSLLKRQPTAICVREKRDRLFILLFVLYHATVVQLRSSDETTAVYCIRGFGLSPNFSFLSYIASLTTGASTCGQASFEHSCSWWKSAFAASLRYRSTSFQPHEDGIQATKLLDLFLYYLSFITIENYHLTFYIGKSCGRRRIEVESTVTFVG